MDTNDKFFINHYDEYGEYNSFDPVIDIPFSTVSDSMNHDDKIDDLNVISDKQDIYDIIQVQNLLINFRVSISSLARVIHDYDLEKRMFDLTYQALTYTEQILRDNSQIYSLDFCISKLIVVLKVIDRLFHKKEVDVPDMKANFDYLNEIKFKIEKIKVNM